MPTAVINVNSSGDNALSIAASGKKLRINAISFTADGTVDVTIKIGSTTICGPMHFVEGSGFPPICPACGLWADKTDAAGTNQDLKINLSGAVQVGGFVDYTLY